MYFLIFVSLLILCIFFLLFILLSDTYAMIIYWDTDVSDYDEYDISAEAVQALRAKYLEVNNVNRCGIRKFADREMLYRD